MLTQRPEETVENDIQSDVQTIVAAIGASGWRCAAIYLVGSFGRGEGSVRFDGTRWRALNDYDLLVVTDGPLPEPGLVKKLGRDLATEVRTDFVDIGFLPSAGLPRLAPTIENYDFKYASTLLAGRDLRAQIPDFSAGDIAPYEFARLICNRTAGLISASTPQRAGSAGYRVNQYLKACIAVGDTAVYLESGYHPSYRQRLARWLALGAELTSVLGLPSAAIATLVDAYETKLGIRNIDGFRVEESVMKVLIDGAFRAIAAGCLGPVSGSLNQVGAKLERYVSSRSGAMARLDAMVASWLRPDRRPPALVHRVLFSLPGYYAGGAGAASQRLHYLRDFWCVPRALLKPWQPQSAYLLWEEYCH